MEEGRRIERPTLSTLLKGSSLVANHLAVPSLFILEGREVVETSYLGSKPSALAVELSPYFKMD